MGTTLNLQQAEPWSRDNQKTVGELLALRAFAEIERKRVDSYLRPIFDSFDFRDRDGEKITNPRNLYLCEDEALCRAYYNLCDAENRKHGFTGPQDHCPALIAEDAAMAAEQALLLSAGKALGFDGNHCWGDLRKKMLHCLIGLCITVNKAA